MSSPFTPTQLSLKSQFTSLGSPWNPTWESVLRLDPTYFAAYLRLHLVPATRRHLAPKIQELLLLAIDASVMHLFRPGIRAHVAAALQLGATPAEVLELCSVLGVHAVNVGVPLLGEVLREEGLDAGPAGPMDEQRGELKRDFERKRGYWHKTWDQVLELDPDSFEAYTHFSAVPFRQRDADVGADAEEASAGPAQGMGTGLSAKVKELVYIAIDCATTHLYVPGLKLHIRNAVRLGVTREGVMEVFELASLMGGCKV